MTCRVTCVLNCGHETVSGEGRRQVPLTGRNDLTVPLLATWSSLGSILTLLETKQLVILLQTTTPVMSGSHFNVTQ